MGFFSSPKNAGDDDEPSDLGVAGAALRWPPQRRKEPQAVGCACGGARKGAAAGGVATEQVAAVLRGTARERGREGGREAPSSAAPALSDMRDN